MEGPAEPLVIPSPLRTLLAALVCLCGVLAVHAEEAAYLRAVALERAGRREDARAAARAYLSRYPAGDHAAQARRLARD